MKTPLDSIPELDAMRMGVDYRHPVRIRNFTVFLRPLAIVETIQVTSTVAGRMEEFSAAGRNRITEHTLVAKETLKIASTDDVDSKEAGKLTDYILDRMTADELDAIFKEYVAICDRTNPVLEQMSKEELEELVSGIKKKAGSELESQLTELSRWELVNICRSLLAEPKSD